MRSGGRSRKLEALLAERHRAEEELADAAGKREAATAALYRLKSAGERLELRRESASALVESLRHAATRPRLPTGPSPAELRRRKLREEAGLARERLAALERTLAEREGVPPAARALAEARLRAPPLQAGGRSWRRACRRRSPSRPRRRRGRRPTSRRRFGSSTKPGPAASGASTWSSTKPSTNSSSSSATSSCGSRPLPSPARGSATTRRRGRCGSSARPRKRCCWSSRLAAARSPQRSRSSSGEAEAVVDEPAERTTLDDGRYRPHIAAAERLERALAAAGSASDRWEPTLRARADAGTTRTAELADELRRLGGAEAEIRREAGEAANGCRRDRRRARPARGRAARRLSGDSRLRRGAGRGRRPRGARRAARAPGTPARGARTASIRSPRRSTSARRSGSRSSTAQREDLERSLDELAKLRDELDRTVERRFAETFEPSSAHFDEVACDALPGRRRSARADRREPRATTRRRRRASRSSSARPASG